MNCKDNVVDSKSIYCKMHQEHVEEEDIFVEEEVVEEMGYVMSVLCVYPYCLTRLETTKWCNRHFIKLNRVKDRIQLHSYNTRLLM